MKDGDHMKTYSTSLHSLLTALVVLGISFNLAGYGATPADTGDDQDVEVQTRGPVHEAFAGVVTYNPEPGVIVPKAPPPNIQEVPPDEKPAGDNVAWIPGYWAWDDDRHDFLWVSGVWRALPPGRQWVPGYWSKVDTGYQWISGYWADARATETTYLPAPPATLENGPNIPAPAPDDYWVPGCWVWSDGQFAWRPGYWVGGQPDWEWVPACYTWTPRGYIFVEGYWDYPVERRGVLFAPVYYAGPVYAQPGYYYSPVVVIDLTVFPDYLFIRPRCHHYYFGDYYALSYYHAGFYAWFSFQSRHHGYDPIYAHRSWEHRRDPTWRRDIIKTYNYRRNHEDARPPRTWRAEHNLSASAVAQNRSLAVAMTFNQLTRRQDSPVRFQPVAQDERQRIVQREREVIQTREERRTVETHAGPAKSGKQIQPSKAKLAPSPIIAPPTEQPGDFRSPPRERKISQPERKIEYKSTPPASGERPKNQLMEKPAPRRETPTVVQPSAPRRESAPKVQPAPQGQSAPSRREAPPQTEQPSRREPPPRETKPDRSVKERAPDNSRGGDQGRDQNRDRSPHKGNDKGNDQYQQPPDR